MNHIKKNSTTLVLSNSQIRTALSRSIFMKIFERSLIHIFTYVRIYFNICFISHKVLHVLHTQEMSEASSLDTFLNKSISMIKSSRQRPESMKKVTRLHVPVYRLEKHLPKLSFPLRALRASTIH